MARLCVVFAPWPCVSRAAHLAEAHLLPRSTGHPCGGREDSQDELGAEGKLVPLCSVLCAVWAYTRARDASYSAVGRGLRTPGGVCACSRSPGSGQRPRGAGGPAQQGSSLLDGAAAHLQLGCGAGSYCRSAAAALGGQQLVTTAYLARDTCRCGVAGLPHLEQRQQDHRPAADGGRERAAWLACARTAALLPVRAARGHESGCCVVDGVAGV